MSLIVWNSILYRLVRNTVVVQSSPLPIAVNAGLDFSIRGKPIPKS